MFAPILKAELLHQRAQATQGRRVLRWLAQALLTVGVLIALGLFAVEWISAYTYTDATVWLDNPTLQRLVLNLLPLALLPLTLIVHITLLLRTLMLSSETIRRERRNQTWELLKLTDLSAARIVVGKWGATIFNLAPLALLLSVLRVGVIVFIGLELFRFDNFYFDRNSVQFFFNIASLPLFVHWNALLIGAALVGLFSFATLLMTAALGLLVSLLRRGGHGGDQVALGLVLRTVLLGLPALLTFFNAQGRGFGDAVFANALGVTLLDNGTLVSAAALTAPRDRLNFVLGSTSTQFYPPEVIAYVLGAYVLIMLGALALSIWLVRRR